MSGCLGDEHAVPYSRAMSILLIRHGETDSNRERIVQLPETPLSTRGRDQAERLAQRFLSAPPAAILSSDLSRAAETAAALSRAIGHPVEEEPLLQERHFGDLRGIAYADLVENPFGPNYSPPGGESWSAFHDRVDRAWERIVERRSSLQGDLAVVTHGLVLHSLAVRHLAWPGVEAPAPENGPPLAFGNTSVSVVEANAPWRITLQACTAHLEDDASGGISGL